MSSSAKSKNDKEREKIVQDRLQILLTRMLQDDDNKYCVDCDSKGPRWASWNLGIFMCIRCAGIHRNLGVHISKVKSVNLDSWTPQQVASMQLTGNSRGRAIYEAQLSEDFRRPQTDSQLEVFIRAKYEKKKYIAREWVPPRAPEFPVGWNELIEAEKLKKDPRGIQLPPSVIPSAPAQSAATAVTTPTTSTTARPNTTIATSVPQKKETPIVAPPEPNLLSNDLLGLSIGGGGSTPASKPVPTSNFSSDLLGLSSNATSDFDFLGGITSASNASNVQNNVVNNNPPHTSKSESNLFDLDSNGGFGCQNSKSETSSTTAKMSKDSIMALFNQPPPQQQQHQMTAQPQQFMTNFAAGQANHQINNFGIPMNNPFLVTPSAAHSTPNIAQSKTSAFSDLTSLNFFQ